MIKWLQSYFEGCCDEDWEHQYGIRIQTLDNPGWTIDIDLTETLLDEIPFEEIRIERAEHDWIFCRVQNRQFKGDGGIGNLEEIIGIFRQWVEKHRGQTPSFVT